MLTRKEIMFVAITLSVFNYQGNADTSPFITKNKAFSLLKRVIRSSFWSSLLLTECASYCSYGEVHNAVGGSYQHVCETIKDFRCFQANCPSGTCCVTIVKDCTRTTNYQVECKAQNIRNCRSEIKHGCGNVTCTDCNSGFYVNAGTCTACSPACSRGGVCSSHNTCKCNRQYTGSRCEIPVCNPPCLHGGTCTAPDICICKPGYEGKKCETAVCNPNCLNGGSCVAPDVCDCKPGYLGDQCQLGGDSGTLLTPEIHLTHPDTNYQGPLSWYSEPELSMFGKVCLIKISLQTAQAETLLTTVSKTSMQGYLGNYTVGAAGKRFSINATSRCACMEFRCPDKDVTGDVILEISTISARQICNVSYVNQLDKADLSSQPRLKFIVEPGKDYGPRYGIYKAYGDHKQAKYAAQKMCMSGSTYGSNTIWPSRGVAATYNCK